ncbi:MAG: hypothetical protein HMLKMBBP_00185 [Planctomycetes bacterium]|nr:hypothetical protein [Planctomycetota bacterium]
MRSMMVAAATALLTFAAGAALAGKGDKAEPKITVRFAKSWDTAVAEAKELNLPLIVHSHGFY